MKMLLIDSRRGEDRVIETEGGLDNYYKLLDCEIIDITTRSIGGVFFDIICDDEGLLKDDRIVSAVDKKGRPALVGNLLISKADEEEGRQIGLTDEELFHVQLHIAEATSPDGEHLHVIVLDEEEGWDE